MEQPARDFWQTKPRYFWWLYEAKKMQSDAIKGKAKGGHEFKKGEAKALRKWMDAHNASQG